MIRSARDYTKQKYVVIGRHSALSTLSYNIKQGNLTNMEEVKEYLDKYIKITFDEVSKIKSLWKSMYVDKKL